ncbi:hypothetical protein MMC25_001674 [Agyrium rufum]|nr:hypothetical protein [Agyrium rufum]
MDTASDNSPAPSTRGVKGVFSKVKTGFKDIKSTSSLSVDDSASLPIIPSPAASIRGSVDSNSVLGQSSIAAGGSEPNLLDNDSDGEGARKLSKLIPGNKKRKRRKLLEAQLKAAAENGPFRGRPVDAGQSTVDTADERRGLGGTDSTSTLNDDDESLLTNDSESSSPVSTPPPLVTHPSHVGYLTSSSPQVKAYTGSRHNSTDNGDPRSRSTERANTLPASRGVPSSTSKLASAATFSPQSNGSILTFDSGDAAAKNTRSVSPGTRLKDAFKPSTRRKEVDNTQNGGLDENGVNPAGMKSGESFDLGRRGSMTSRRTSIGADTPLSTPPPIQTQDLASKPFRGSLPSLVVRPETPPSAPFDPPMMNVTPPTPVDRANGQPFAESPSRKSPTTPKATANTNIVTSPSGNMISHRRGRSDSASRQPSKLSNSMSAPLTPMPEETAKTPLGSRTSSGNQVGGAGSFFSSVFSAAQNAANQFTNTLNQNQGRPRSGTQATEDDTGSVIHQPAVLQEEQAVEAEPPKKLAIDTIGQGDLSLSQLGIALDPTPVESAAANRTLSHDEASARVEDAQAARAISVAYGEKVGEEGATPVVEDPNQVIKPPSTYEASMVGERTSPNGSLIDGEVTNSPWRTGSVKSRVRRASRRGRNNSANTANSVSAAIGASHAAFSQVNGSVPRLTGFAVASKKRNRDFHQLFRSVPEDDYLIEDYSCALQREILLAGRIYVAEGHICFSSNILGWVTTLVISFDEVVSIEKENTAMVFPNAIAIQTLQARHTFRSLLGREATYDLLIGIWKIHHPNLNHTSNGARLTDGGTGDKTEKADPAESDEEGSEHSEDGEEVYDEDEEEGEAAGSFAETLEGSVAGSEVLPEPVAAAKQAVARKASAMGLAAGQAAGGVPTTTDAKAIIAATNAAANSADFPGPAAHAPTDCQDGATHYDKVLSNDVIPGPLGKVYSMVFGTASGGFMSKWLIDEMKCWDLQMEDIGLTTEGASRTYSYIKPLGGSIGPKQTKCIVTETVDFMDYEKSVSITSSTQTPDVPSGSVFTTKTKFCFSWGPGNGTRLQINCGTEWSGKSWLKVPIEKGANDGQQAYANDLLKALKIGLAPTRGRSGTNASKLGKSSKKGASGGAAGGKTKRADTDASKSSIAVSSRGNPNARPKSNWGPLEPLHDILGPVGDILGPLWSSNTVIVVLLFLLVMSWFRDSRARSGSGGGLMTGRGGVGRYGSVAGLQGLSAQQRAIAYEEIWREEESALWDWMEERVGMRNGDGDGDEIAAVRKRAGVKDQEKVSKKIRKERESALKGESVAGTAKKDVEWAIRITEDKLRDLKAGIGLGDGNDVEDGDGNGNGRKKQDL